MTCVRDFFGQEHWTPVTVHLTLERVARINIWLKDDESQGKFYYDQYDAMTEPTVVVRFSCPDTAFAFKMRFG